MPREVSACLIKAELRGVDSHGMVRLPVYARRIQAGVVKARPDIQVRPAGTASALIDGDNGLGPVVGARAMRVGARSRRTHGTGFVGVRHSNHFGPAAYYVEKALSAGCIGLAISNAPPNMAPFGGRTRFLGTNPVAIGVPAGDEPPLIFDASTSVVARGKIIVAAHTGTAIPEGWAIDPDGYPTTDAQQALAGAVLPFGGPKGSAISFIIDVFCGVLTGAAFGSHLNTLENLSSSPERRARARGRADRPVRQRRRIQIADGRDPADAQGVAAGARGLGACWCRVRSSWPMKHAHEQRASSSRGSDRRAADGISATELGVPFPSLPARDVARQRS